MNQDEHKKETADQKLLNTSWLKLLELQSWQAELLISGVIIASLLQLPYIYIQWVEGYLYTSSELGFFFLSFASTLILGSINCLVFFLGVHFLLRSIWIALLGLNSVYPDGINTASTNSAGPKYWKKAKEKYPNLSAYNETLDEQCSLIFSMTAAATIGMTAFSFLILLVYLLFNLIIGIFPTFEDYAVPVGIGLYLLFTAATYALQYAAKKYPEDHRVENLLTLYSDFFGSLFGLFFFQKPMGYISGILISNSTSKKSFYIIMVFSIMLGFISSIQTQYNPIFQYLDPQKYYQFNNKADRFLAYNYDNLRPQDTRIFTPLLPSDIVKGSVLPVFIPIIEREKSAMDLTEFNFFEKVMTKRSFRDSIMAGNLDRYKAFNQIEVNDSIYEGLEFQHFTHPNANEKGVLVYIPTDRFLQGKNTLVIKKNYFSKKNLQKIIRIPFYFER